MTTKVYFEIEIKSMNHSSDIEHGNVNRLPGLCSSGHFAGPEPEAMSASTSFMKSLENCILFVLSISVEIYKTS